MGARASAPGAILGGRLPEVTLEEPVEQPEILVAAVLRDGDHLVIAAPQQQPRALQADVIAPLPEGLPEPGTKQPGEVAATARTHLRQAGSGQRGQRVRGQRRQQLLQPGFGVGAVGGGGEFAVHQGQPHVGRPQRKPAASGLERRCRRRGVELLKAGGNFGLSAKPPRPRAGSQVILDEGALLHGDECAHHLEGHVHAAEVGDGDGPAGQEGPTRPRILHEEDISPAQVGNPGGVRPVPRALPNLEEQPSQQRRAPFAPRRHGDIHGRQRTGERFMHGSLGVPDKRDGLTALR